jgi:hypothetical protein
MRVMSAGDGYKYLLKSVAAGDGSRDLSTPFTRYYAEKGTPPGFWIGADVASLGDGLIAAGDVVFDKVRALYDSKWRSLDGRPMHAAVVALSEHYNALLADRLSRDLGVAWESRERGRNRNPAWEIVGVEDALIDEFSSRARDIDAETDRLIAEYERSHGRRPSPDVIVKLRATATLATRPEKRIQALSASPTCRQSTTLIARSPMQTTSHHSTSRADLPPSRYGPSCSFSRRNVAKGSPNSCSGSGPDVIRPRMCVLESIEFLAFHLRICKISLNYAMNRSAAQYVYAPHRTAQNGASGA